MTDISDKVVARIQKEGSREYSMQPVIQQNTSKARVALSQLENLIDRATELINESEYKEHIYAEAGDMIFNVGSLVEEIEECILSLSYLSSQKDQKKIKSKIPASMRKEIDDIVKHSSISDRVVHRIASSSYPDGGPANFVNKSEQDTYLRTDQTTEDPVKPEQAQESEGFPDESIFNVDNADDLLKHQEQRRDITDWSGMDTSYIRPGDIPDSIKYH